VTSPQRPSPAVRLAGMRSAAEERTERPELLHPPETPRPERAARLHTILGRTLARSVEHVISWYQGFRDRQLLASLDDRQLRDIGIDRATVGSDSTTSFWLLREPVGTDCAVERRLGRHAGDGERP